MDDALTAKLRAPIPSQLIKQLNGNDYISGQTAIDRLIQATGNEWSFRITNVVGSDTHVAMQGELTIGGHTRAAWGEAKTTKNAKEELYKNAETDTIKRCARLFGVALELYGDLLDEETGEVTSKSAPSARRQRPQAPQRPDNRKYAHAAANAAQIDAEGVDGPSNEYGMATEKQAKFIGHLLKQLDWSREDAERFLDANYGVHRISELGSRQDVSSFIERLQAIKEANEPPA